MQIGIGILRTGGQKVKDIFFKTIMLKGEAGGTIASIEKTSSELNVDTYTITLNDGTTTTFEVTNGTSIESIEKTATSGYQDTYTITLTDGSTSTFVVMNGEDGAGYEVPTDSIIYWDSADTIPEGYEAATDPETSRIPYSIYMGNVQATFATGAASVTLASLGLTGATIVSILAAPSYVSASIGADCYCTCQVTVSGINIYMRDGISNTIPADGDYRINLFIAYTI